MVGAAMETTLIIDSSKFGSRKIYSVVPMKQIKRIITDEGLAQEDRDKYAALVDELVIAPFWKTRFPNRMSNNIACSLRRYVPERISAHLL